MTNTSTLPALAAIVVVPDTFQTVARTMRALALQTAAAQIEIVFVTTERATIDLPWDELRMFHSVQTCTLRNIDYGSGLAAGVRAAHAPIVACTEDHAFPAPNWSERLIAAHQTDYAVVGPAMRNGNPTSFVSWADFYMGYGKWADPIASGPVDFLMAHNASYKRSILLGYGAQLEEKMAVETVLHYELGAQGHGFWLEATTYTEHLNHEYWRVFVQACFLSARLFAAARAAQWTVGKRLLYFLASPLIPCVRFVRIRQDVLRAKFPWRFRWRLYGALTIGLMADAVGQALGFALGRGATQAQVKELEFHRERYVKPASTAMVE